MRLLLDAHLSDRAIGNPLRSEGHDVRSINVDAGTAHMKDHEVVALAIAEQRIVVTADVTHFTVLPIRLASAVTDHFGMILIPKSINTSDFGVILAGVRDVLAGTTSEDWLNRVEWLKRR
jgi:hypothetical protein